MRTSLYKLKMRRVRATLLGHSHGPARLSSRQSTTRATGAPVVDPATAIALQRQAEIEHDLLLARDIQQGLLLEAVPRVPGWEISAVSLPARDLGGDLYDFLPFGQNRQGIMIGDVSGKGLPAALRMAVARTVFRHEARRGLTPGSTLGATNRGVLKEIPQGMVTMLYALLDTQHGLVTIANAGHNYAVLVNGMVQELELSGLPLGVDDESEYNEISTTLGYGDTLVFYTDGIIEATNANDELFGYERLEALLRDHLSFKPRALVTLLLHEVRAWSASGQADDITIVIVRRRLARLDAELQSVAEDVLGRERALALWESLPLPRADPSMAAWSSVLPDITKVVQTQFGRGLARELNGQLRLALEEYR